MTTPASVAAPRGPRAAIAAASRRRVVRWLGLALVVLVITFSFGSTQEVEPRLAWGVSPDEARLLETFPPKWEVGQSWVVEVEESSAIRSVTSSRDCHVRLPFYRYRVTQRKDDVVLLRVQWMSGEYGFMVRLDPFRVVGVPEEPYALGELSLEVGRGNPWKLWVPREPLEGCTRGHRHGWQLPSGFPILVGAHESVGARMGPRTIFGAHQELSFRPDGLLEVRLRSAEDVELQRTRIQVWRKGDPWWAKVECDQPHVPPQPPTGYRSDQMFRARLIAVDDKPVEVLPWELPPEKWLLIPRRCRGDEHFTEPDPTPPFERYKWEWRDMREPDDMRPSWQR